MDLPDDLKLDDDNDDAGKEEEQTQEDAGRGFSITITRLCNVL